MVYEKPLKTKSISKYCCDYSFQSTNTMKNRMTLNIFICLYFLFIIWSIIFSLQSSSFAFPSSQPQFFYSFIVFALPSSVLPPSALPSFILLKFVPLLCVPNHLLSLIIICSSINYSLAHFLLFHHLLSQYLLFHYFICHYVYIVPYCGGASNSGSSISRNTQFHPDWLHEGNDFVSTVFFHLWKLIIDAISFSILLTIFPWPRIICTNLNVWCQNMIHSVF